MNHNILVFGNLCISYRADDLLRLVLYGDPASDFEPLDQPALARQAQD